MDNSEEIKQSNLSQETLKNINVTKVTSYCDCDLESLKDWEGKYVSTLCKKHISTGYKKKTNKHRRYSGKRGIKQREEGY